MQTGHLMTDLWRGKTKSTWLVIWQFWGYVVIIHSSIFRVLNVFHSGHYVHANIYYQIPNDQYYIAHCYLGLHHLLMIPFWLGYLLICNCTGRFITLHLETLRAEVNLTFFLEVPRPKFGTRINTRDFAIIKIVFQISGRTRNNTCYMYLYSYS